MLTQAIWGISRIAANLLIGQNFTIVMGIRIPRTAITKRL
jgi:hypothetical protein